MIEIKKIYRVETNLPTVILILSVIGIISNHIIKMKKLNNKKDTL